MPSKLNVLYNTGPTVALDQLSTSSTKLDFRTSTFSQSMIIPLVRSPVVTSYSFFVPPPLLWKQEWEDHYLLLQRYKQ